MASVINTIYQEKRSILQFEISRYKKLDAQYALLRLGIVIAGSATTILAFRHTLVIGVATILVIAIIFFLVYIKHEAVKEKIKFNNNLLLINGNEISCLNEHINFYYDGKSFLNIHHHYSGDLDVFGPNSIFGLINRCKTFYGNQYLASYLSELGTLQEIKERREAISEMKDMSEWRQNFHAFLLNIEEDPNENFSSTLIKDLDKDFTFFDKKIWKIILFLTPAVWVGIVIAALIQIPFVDTSAFVFGGFIFTLYYFYIKRINEIQFTISRGNELLSVYADALKEVYHFPWKSPLLKELTNLSYEQKSAIESMYELKKIMDKLDYRLNMVAGIILNLFMLWDFRIVRKLSKWKKSNFAFISQLFMVLGKMEALCSLSNWAYNHPDYVHADIHDKSMHMEGLKLVHPLMVSGQCVPNDFTLDPGSNINVITGSNMSGKSTFLRTLGTNMVLAYAGTVSAAERLTIPLLRIVTYMRIKDALEENVSTFKAELDRIKMILDYIKTGERCLFLIDEMLRGTNSNDKLKGSMAIVKTLLDNRAYAVIATHDIKLAEMENDYPKNIRNYYFDIAFQGDELKFDYVLKEGICSNFNASYLLERIGIK